MLDIIILAAGKGTRMKSDKPKVLHTLAGKPFLQHVIDRARELKASNIYIVVGHGADQVRQCIGSADDIEYIEQTEQLGTGHAVQQVLPYLNDKAKSLILYGDVPLIATKTLESLLACADDKTLGLLTVTLDDPTGYGRIIKNGEGQVLAIVEQKDADVEQLKIQEVNTGVMAVHGQHLQQWLPKLRNDNAQGEYYLTDIIAMASKVDVEVKTAAPQKISETFGVNNRQQQAELERFYQQEFAAQLMQEGLNLMDPARFDCRGSLRFGKDCSIDVNCVLEGDIVLGDNVSIGPNCHIINATIGTNSEIKSHSIIEDAELHNDVTVGPFARLRPQTLLSAGAKVGNFVETKKAVIGKGSKVNHLSYVGDADVGENVNIGAGTITCNYDGANKFKTKIDDGVFVGSNSALVAPIHIEENATIAAGSTITQNVKAGALSVARTRQKNIDGWQRPKKK
ncbi:Bifunctional protein GlmU [Thalassocella blandensis]|nr:Bifunctional protein GlmU [Thalassocella blandensis]